MKYETLPLRLHTQTLLVRWGTPKPPNTIHKPTCGARGLRENKRPTAESTHTTRIRTAVQTSHGIRVTGWREGALQGRLGR